MKNRTSSPWRRRGEIVVAAFALLWPARALAEAADAPAAQSAAEAVSSFGAEPPAPPTAAEVPRATTFDQLAARLLDADAATRINAVRLLGRLRGLEVIARLGRVIRTDPVPDVRGWALRALHEIGTERARRTAIVTSAGDRDPRVQQLVRELFPDRASRRRTPPRAIERRELESDRDVGRGRETDPTRGLRLGGWLTLGAAYGMTLAMAIIVTAVEPSVGGMNFIPVLGPILSVALQPNGDFTAVYIVGLVAALGQVIGLSLGIAGEARRVRWRRRQRRQRWRRLERRRRGLAVLPGGPGGLGVSLAGAF